MIVLYYFTPSSSAPKYLQPVIDLMEMFNETALRDRKDLDMLVTQMRLLLQVCKKGRMRNSTPTVELYSGQITLRPKSQTDEWSARISFMKIDKRKTFDEKLFRFVDLTEI